MDKKDKNSTKNLGPQAARLILTLYERNRSTFTLDEARQIIGLEGQSFRNFIHRLVKKNILTNLTTGLYTIVPFELGNRGEFMTNQFVIAREVVKKKLKNIEAQYYISHASAMEIHQMVTQPLLIVYTTVTKQIKQNPNVLGTEFRFVTCKSDHFFGVKKFWIDKSEMVFVSNLEKTIIDGLKRPDYCGGITEVAKGFWMKRDDINISRLVDYACSMNVGAIYRRLGFLLELYKMKCSIEIERLQGKLTKSYILLDPNLLNEGEFLSRWKLRLNISEKEFLSVIRT